MTADLVVYEPVFDSLLQVLMELIVANSLCINCGASHVGLGRGSSDDSPIKESAVVRGELVGPWPYWLKNPWSGKIYFLERTPSAIPPTTPKNNAPVYFNCSLSLNSASSADN